MTTAQYGSDGDAVTVNRVIEYATINCPETSESVRVAAVIVEESWGPTLRVMRLDEIGLVPAHV